MKKYAVVLLKFQISIGQSFKAHHDVIYCAAMKEENQK